MKTLRYILIVCVAAGGFGSLGCYDPEAVKAFLQQPRTPVSGMEYRILPPDVIEITSLHVAEIHNTRHVVRPDGRINIPLLGEIEVAGRTPREVEELLADAAGLYYDKFSATVTVTEYESQFFYVFGEVLQPGPYRWTGRDSLLDALSKAQPNRYAWPERIVVVRGDDPQTGGMYREESAGRGDYEISGVRPELRDRPRKKLTVNMMAMIEHGDLSNNILLRPEDVIYVQPNPFAKVGFFLEMIGHPVGAASDILQDARYGYEDLRFFRHAKWNDDSTIQSR